MRVFGSSSIVDRPSERLSVRTIPLSGYIDRRFHHTYHFYSNCLIVLLDNIINHCIFILTYSHG